LLLFGEVETVSNRLFGNLILPLNLRGSFENADMNRPIIVIDSYWLASQSPLTSIQRYTGNSLSILFAF